VQFMFQGDFQRLYRADILEALRLQESDRSLHEIVYPGASAPRRGLTGGIFPTDDQIRPLFRLPFPPGSRRLPDMLIPEVRVIHNALRHSLLPRIGNAESITSLQQWLILSIFTHQPFDIVDFILCEIEDVIADGMTMVRQQPYAHIISFLLAQTTRPPEFFETYESSRSFKVYAPAPPTDRRRGQRAMAHAQEQIPPEDRERVAVEDEALAEAEADLPQAFLDIASDSDSDSSDHEFLPPLPRRHDHEAGGSAQGMQHSASVPSAPESTHPVPPPAASSSEFSQFLQQMQQQQQMLVQ
jgi:hypothetical protein